MTGRVCPVHGEYAADGVCRWCEPEESPAQELARINAGLIGEAPGARALRDVKAYAEALGAPPKTLLDVALSGPKVRPLPVAEATPWASKPSGADQSTITFQLMCICQKCLRGFDAPIPLTSLLCPECRNPPTYMGAPVVLDAGVSSFADAPPILVSWTLIEKTDEAYGWRLEWAAPVPPGPELNADKERRLLAQHAALRWERVARRWATKANCEGHERTVDGTLAYDDRCAECRRAKRLTDAGIPKERP